MPPSDEDKRDQSGLVTEARPIAFADLSEAERVLITGTADPWIEAVVRDSKYKKPAANEIDEYRSGRVLFIDGPRGVGKTTFLLTLLKRWESSDNSGKYGSVSCNSELRIFRPVLDFDPLPHGMPLHGWLLEPWRKRAEDLDNKAGSASALGSAGADSGDLTEQFAELFERAVIGWTSEHIEGKGVVQKALAYQERVDGWSGTIAMWNKFVGATICRSTGCFDDGKKCKHAHRIVFVVVIDDVDLQVEHLPELIHAIRLFHHPNVAYVLTGNYDHLRFALLLDYLHRHEHKAGRHNPKTPWDEIDKHSKRLREAFLEKALPSHARLELRHLCFREVLDFSVGSGRKLKELLNADVLKALPLDVRELGLVTARQAQQAVDKFRAHQSGTGSLPTNTAAAPSSNTIASIDTLRFISDLCDANITEKKGTAQEWQSMLRGKLTTRRGDVLRSWEGRNRTTVLLAERPRFVFSVDSSEDERAHRALIVQLLAEQKAVRAPALTWAPDACILTTEVRWDSKVTEIDGLAVFNWPVLVRPTASEIINLQEIARVVSDNANGSTQTALTPKMLCIWLSKNIEWCYARDGMVSHMTIAEKQFWDEGKTRWAQLASKATLENIANELRNLSKCGDELNYETKYWVREVLIMAAPYWGLSESTASELMSKLPSIPEIKPTGPDLRTEQARVVKDGIIAPRDGAAHFDHDLSDKKKELESSDYEKAVDDFLVTREKAEPKHPWWQWLKDLP